jgi:hypothetical protein
MFERSDLSRYRRGGCVSRLFRFAGMAAVFWVVAVLMIGQSQACPKHSKGGYDHKTVVVIVHKLSATPVASASRSNINCCGHCGGMVCANGCCSACASALLAFNPVLNFEDVLSVYVVPRDAGFAPAKPPPDLRPPRTFA